MSRGEGELPRFKVDPRLEAKWKERLARSHGIRNLLRSIAETQKRIRDLEEQLHGWVHDLDEAASDLNDFKDFHPVPGRINEFEYDSLPRILAERKNPKWWLDVYARFCAYCDTRK